MSYGINIVLGGCGHFAAEERPLELAAALKSFLAPSFDTKENA